MILGQSISRARRLMFFSLSLCLLLTAGAAVAQRSTGTIMGLIKDSSGAVVPGAVLTVRSPDTGLVRTTTTGSDGSYRFPALPPGKYDVTAEMAGFKTETHQGLVLEVTQEESVNFTLQVGRVEEQVTVTGEAALVETTNSTVGGLVNEAKISNLPLNGRNYIDLTLMQVGVSEAAYAGKPGGSVGVYFSSNGNPVRSNNYMMDGSPIVNFYGEATSSLAGTTLGIEGIREYKVVTNTFSAEYGMNMGSQMTIVTKSGTNSFHGSAFEYLRNSALDARNFFDYGTTANNFWRLPPFKRNNFGGSIGGPIKKDKTFFFATYEGLRQRLGQTIITNVPAAGCHGKAGDVITPTACPQISSPTTVAPLVAPLLALYPNPNLANNQYTFPFTQPTRVDYVQGRVDHAFSQADSLFVRYSMDDSYQYNQASFSRFNNDWTSRNQFTTVSETHVFSPTLLNTFRLGFTRTVLYQAFKDDLTGPEYSFIPPQPIGAWSITGLTGFGPTAMNPVGKQQNLWSWSDDVFWTKGKHGLKFGALVNKFADGTFDNFYIRGQLWFSNLASFLQGNPYQQSVLAPGGHVDRYFRYWTIGLYAQDDFRVNSRLTLNLGLRWEIATQMGEMSGRENSLRDMKNDAVLTPGPVIAPQSKNNWGPRVGFAWDVFGTGKTSVRGGFGMAYDVAGGWHGTFITFLGLGDAPWSTTVSTSNPKFTIPLTLPNTTLPMIANLPLTPEMSLRLPDYYFKVPYNLQYNLFIGQELPGSIGLNIGYLGTRGIHLPQLQDGNSPEPAGWKNGLPYWVQGMQRYNPHYMDNHLMNNGADSWYNSLQVGVNKKLSKGLEGQLNYTFSKSLDDGQGWNLSDSGSGQTIPTYRFDARRFDIGPSGFDATHNVRLNVLYSFPSPKGNNFALKLLRGWWTGNIIGLRSGLPLTPTLANGGVNSHSLSGIVIEGGANTDRASLAPSFNADKLILGNPRHWFDATMFTPGTVGMLGNAGRGIIRGPSLRTWDFSINKDTHLRTLGENGALQFRAEFFNLPNYANFGAPSASVFTGSLTAVNEAPLATAGQITSTITTSRQLQFSLKLVF
jgi:outer membrane receptor protein involved in Fe transport